MRVFHIVESSNKTPVGCLYESMVKAKEAIASYYKHVEAEYLPFLKLIDNKWSNQLHKPIHAIGYYLNLKYFYDPSFVEDDEVLTRLYLCLKRMV